MREGDVGIKPEILACIVLACSSTQGEEVEVIDRSNDIGVAGAIATTAPFRWDERAEGAAGKESYVIPAITTVYKLPVISNELLAVLDP